MSLSVLKTKLCVPVPPRQLVSRPHLLLRLNDGLRRKLTLISAPAGFGKTTLLSEWIAGLKQPVAWISLDSGDNDLSVFGDYLTAALQGITAQELPAAITVPSSRQLPLIQRVGYIINKIHDQSKPLVLVLDDYHFITEPAVHNAVTFLLDHLPRNMHLIISGRTDPPLHLARLRAMNQLAEFRVIDLRFAGDEVTQFLNTAMSLRLSPKDVSKLQARTEGWIAALQMAALSLRGRKDASEFVSALSGSDRFIADYLSEEVLAGVPENARSFLFQTAILERMTAPLCDAVIGRDDSQEMLKYLEELNMFLVPLDDKRNWYRYHPLFSELLRTFLFRFLPERVPELHRRASAWFERAGLTFEAIHHATACNDYERAADLIQGIAHKLLIEDKVLNLLTLLAKLPDDVIVEYPQLCIEYGWASLILGQGYRTNLLMNAIESALSDKTAKISDLGGHLLGLRAYIAKRNGDFKAAIELGEKSLKLLPESDQAFKSIVVANIAHSTYELGDMRKACDYYNEAKEIGQTSGNLYVRLASSLFLSHAKVELGQLGEADRLCRETIREGTELGGVQPLQATGYAYVGRGQILYERNELDSAADHLTRAIELGEASQSDIVMLIGYTTLARLKLALGSGDLGMELLGKAEQVATKISGSVDAQQLPSWRIRFSLAKGDLQTAAHLVADQERQLGLHGIPDFRHEQPYLTWALFHIYRGDCSEIPGSLEHLREKVVAEGRLGKLIEILAVEALALGELNQTEPALSRLRQALSLAEAEGYVRIFLDLGPKFERLLNHASWTNSLPDYGHMILQACSTARMVNITACPPADVILPEKFNEREILILRLIAAGLSNRQIADKTHYSIASVKWYVGHIYAKLAVSNRAQAISSAHALHLL